ncbi:MAG: pyridoxal phosphate-dependent aminotransferase [Dysosmobacter sp.]|nr:pyridoxal phosphate-dependent aminotransferase [Clostridiales bacterium]MDY3692225.1 pyridoxal phosphate-dependent aminotransferase [Dysosmobacter sp.]
MKFSSKIQRCELSPVRKFYPYEMAAVEKGLKVRHLNIGQPDIETPRVFFEAISRFSDSVLEYAPAPGVSDFLTATQKYYESLGFHITREDILATYGGSEALQIVMSCILEEGDEVLVPEPFYPNYTTFINITGGKIRPIKTKAEEGYRFATREQIEPLINEHTRAILMTNPGNPTGVVLTREEMRLMADIAKEHDLFLISDEVYREIVYTGEKISSMLELEDAAENVVVIDSVSKRFSATGARVGAVISRNHELMNEAMKLCQGRLCTATLDQVGAAAMYNELPASYYTEVREEYRRRRDAMVTALSKIPGVEFRCPEGAFYLMVTLPVDDTEKLQYFLLEEFQDNGETVMVTPADGFFTDPELGRNKVRIAYVTNPEDVTRAIELLGLGIQAYNARKD